MKTVYSSCGNFRPEMRPHFDWMLWESEGRHIGDCEVYTPGRRNRVADDLRRMCDYYRYIGVAGLNTWMNDQDYSMTGVRVAPIDFQPNVESGGTFKRSIAAFNDGGLPIQYLQYSLGSDYGFIAEGKIDMKTAIDRGQKWDGALEIKMPETNIPRKAKLLVQGMYGTHEQARFEQNIYLLPKKYDLSSLAKSVAIVDPQNKFRDRVETLNLGEAVMTDGKSIPPGVKLLVMAPDAYKVSMRKALDAFVGNGGVVLMMPQKEWTPYRADLPDRDLLHAATQTWIRAKDHPILDGIDEEQLSYWGDDNIVSTETFVKPQAGSFKSIIDCGGISGLVWTPLMEANIGKGAFIMTTLALDKSDPIALRLLANMVTYGCAHPATATDELNVLSGTNDEMRAFLKAIFVKTKDGLGDKGPVLVDASAKATPARLRKVLDQGRTLWLHNFTPETLKDLGDLIPSTVKLTPRPKERIGGMPVGGDPLMNGISNFDFAWYQAPVIEDQWFRKSFWKNSTVTAKPPDMAIEINDPDGLAIPLSAPTFLAKIKSGKGVIILDTLYWEQAIAKEADKSMRTISTLLTNMNVGFNDVVMRSMISLLWISRTWAIGMSRKETVSAGGPIRVGTTCAFSSSTTSGRPTPRRPEPTSPSRTSPRMSAS